MTIDTTPFRIEVPQGDLDDLRERLARTRWPENETVADWSQGIPLAYVREVCEYWGSTYDWPSRQDRLNRFPQYRARLSGAGEEALRIHFIHARSPVPDAMPLVLTHGWPGSTVEFMNIIGPLADPAAHGGDPRDAFHVVAPSLPGYGYSDKPTRTGWGVDRVATAWDELMVGLGYESYGAQGGDWGALVTSKIGAQDLGHCRAIHVNMPLGRASRDELASPGADDLVATDKMKHYENQESGYSKQQATRPQTLGYGLVDSPAAQAAWILEKFWAWTDNNGHPEDAVSRDELLDNVMLYWLNAAGASSARMYWESAIAMSGATISLPAGVAVFPKEVFSPPRRWADRVYTDIRRWTEFDRGGHFAALEEPDLLIEDIRAFFRLMRVKA
jgi:epoxide hydrolase